MVSPWSLVLFTFFFCMAGGTLAMQGLLTLTNRGRKVQVPMLVTSAVALVAGMVALCTRFQHVERLFNVFGSASSGSGVAGLTLALWVGVACLATVVLYFVLIYRREDSVAPRWCGGVAVVAGLCLAVLLGSAYKTSSIPAALVPLLDAYYLFNAILLGGLAALVFGRICDDDEAAATAVKVGLVGTVGSLACVVVYGLALGNVEQAGSTARYSSWSTSTVVTASVLGEDSGATTLLLGQQAPVFWGVVVVLGLVVPAAAMAIGRRAKTGGLPKTAATALALLALVCAIAGSVAWRCLL